MKRTSPSIADFAGSLSTQPFRGFAAGLIFVLLFCASGCGEESRTLEQRQTQSATANRGDDSSSGIDGSKSPPVPAPIEGTWGWVSGERAGEPMMIAPANLWQRFEGSKMTLHAGGRSSEATIEFRPDKEPKQYDVAAGGRVEQGIYRVDGDLLTLCSSKPPRPRPTQFSSSKSDGRSLMVFRRMEIDKLHSPVSRDEARGFADSLERWAASGDGAKVNSAFDFDGILDRITKGFGLAEGTRLSFVYGVQRNSRVFGGNSNQFGAAIAKAVAGGGQYDCVRIHQVGDQMRVLFRLTDPDGGVTLHDLILGRTAYGELKAVDIYLIVMGECMSDMLRRAILPSLAQSTESTSNLGDADKEFIRCQGQLGRWIAAIGAGQHGDAYRLYRGLPASVQREKWVQLLLLQRTQGDERDALLEDCRKMYPGELAFELLYFDGYMKNRQYQSARQSIDRLDERLEGDPYCDVLRAQVFEADNKLEDARNAAKKAVDADARLKGGYVVLVSVALKMKRYDEAVRDLESVEAKFRGELRELPTMENYSSFVGSSEYRAWQNSRPTK